MPASRQAIHSFLQKCSQTKDLDGGRHVHSLIVAYGLESVGLLCDHLLRLFGSCSCLLEANLIFSTSSSLTLYTWHAIISAYSSCGKHHDAIAIFHKMQDDGFEPDKVIYTCVLKACGSIAALLQGRLVHIQTIRAGLHEGDALWTAIGYMYGECGSLEDAHKVFKGMPNRTMDLWSSMIAGHTQHGHASLALVFFKKMLEEDLSPDQSSFLSIVRACASMKATREGLQVHALITIAGFSCDLMIGNTLIDMHAKCGSLEDAHTVFNQLPNRDKVSWGALMKAASQCESSLLSLHLLERMNQEGLQPGEVAFSCAIKTISRIKSLKDGMQMYDMIVRCSFDSNVVVANSLIDMLAKAGCLNEAKKVFKQANAGNIVSWNAMIAGYVQHNDGLSAVKFFEEMQQKSIQPDKATYVCLLRAFSLLGLVKEEYSVHNSMTQSGLMFDTRLANTLIDVYCKFGRLDDAYKVFSHMRLRDAVSWSAMVMGYVQHEESNKAFELFDRMSHEHIKVDQPLFLCMLKACTGGLSLVQGRYVHDMVIDRGFDSDTVVGNALVDMYAKCGVLSEAYAVFERLASRDAITWSAMISAFCHHGLGSQAIEHFDTMQEQGFSADILTLTSILKACAMTGNLLRGMSIHDEIIRMGLHTEVFVGNALVDFYAKCKCLNEARKIFDSLPTRDMVTWGALITGYVGLEQYDHALALFEKMQKAGRLADVMAFSCILKACTGLGIIQQGKLVHDLSIRSGYATHVSIGNTLIDMYSKSGLLEEARKVFNTISRQETVTWNAMIAGYVQHNQGFPAIELFDRMQEESKKPDNVTYMCTLKACACVGAIKYGRAIHDQVIRTGAIEELTVGTTLVDMYANCGCLDEAGRSFENLATRNVVSWNAMIAGYAQLGSLKLASECLERMRKDGLEPDAWSFTSILAACSHEGLVEEGRSYFEMMREGHDAMPSNEHLNCMVELLGSAGQLHEAEKLLQSMPILPDMTGWMTLLGASKTFGNFGLGRACFEHAHDLDFPHAAASYVLMSKICSDLYARKEFSVLRKCRRDVQARKKPGHAWIEISNRVHEFVVGERAHPESVAMYTKHISFENVLISEGFVPQVDGHHT